MSQNNSNDKVAMMPYIEDINKIEGFDPTPFAVEYADLKNGDVRKRLPVVIRIAMFRMKYLHGKIAVQATEVNGGFVATARVYPDYKDAPDEFLAEASAFRAPSPDKPTVSPREWAQTAAVGVALRNAGFGVQFDVAGEDVVETMGDDITITPPSSKTNSTPESETSTTPSTPVETTENSTEEYTVAPNFSETPSMELTFEEQVMEAMKVPCPIAKFNGKPLGEVLREDPNAVVWTATKFSGDEKIKEAAQLICEYAKTQIQESANE